jgi:RecA/RadA recombinase
MSLMDKLKKNSRIKDTDVLSHSKFFADREVVQTGVPMLDVALSGMLDGGLVSGLTTLAGPSKHFKTSFALMIASAYLKKYDDSVLLFYDSEFGSPQSYFTNFGIDTNRVLHTPIKSVEELKFDIMNQLDNIERGDRIIIMIDSIGNLASKKEIEDAINEKSVADMSRAKQLKGLFRMVTPHLHTKDFPLVAINHTYETMEMFSQTKMSGGTGIYYSSDSIFFVGRRQNKKNGEVLGYEFIINIEKSRFVKEKSKVPITVSWEGGVEPYSGLLDVAIAGGFVHKGKKGNANGFAHMDPETGEVAEDLVYEKETLKKEFWDDILEDQRFKDFVKNMYSIDRVSNVDPSEFLEEEVIE